MSARDLLQVGLWAWPRPWALLLQFKADFVTWFWEQQLYYSWIPEIPFLGDKPARADEYMKKPIHTIISPDWILKNWPFLVLPSLTEIFWKNPLKYFYHCSSLSRLHPKWKKKYIYIYISIPVRDCWGPDYQPFFNPYMKFGKLLGKGPLFEMLRKCHFRTLSKVRLRPCPSAYASG